MANWISISCRYRQPVADLGFYEEPPQVPVAASLLAENLQNAHYIRSQIIGQLASQPAMAGTYPIFFYSNDGTFSREFIETAGSTFVLSSEYVSTQNSGTLPTGITSL